MKRMLKGCLALAALFAATQTSAAVSHYTRRSNSRDEARRLVGVQHLINRCDYDTFYGVFDVVLQYEQSFRNDRIARCIFGSDVSCGTSCATDCNTGCDTGCDDSACLTVSGSRFGGGAANDGSGRGANDWLAEYFGLPTDFQSTICFAPRIQSFNADLGLYFGLDEWAEGMYFAIHAPITWTKWELRASENVTDEGTLGYDAGYFTAAAVTNATLDANVTKALDFLTGEKAPVLDANTTFQKLDCCKFTACDCNNSCQTKTRLSDIEATLGWNFFCGDDYHFGLSLKAAAPTGNTPTGKTLFEPLVGSEHWKLGGGLSAHSIWWQSEDEDRSFGMWVEATVWHLFKHCQTRCFDLCGKENSRYALAMKVNAANTDGANFREVRGTTAGTGTLATSLFNNEYAPVANLTKQNVDVSVGVEGSVLVKLGYKSCGFGVDLGYEFWGRSCEKFCARSDCKVNQLDGKTWALKGDAHVFGFEATTDVAVPLSATNDAATIHGGTNQNATTIAAGTQDNNTVVDGAQLAFGNNAAATSVALNAQPGAGGQTNTSIQPVFLSQCDLDLSGSKGTSHKVFGYFGYTWENDEDWTTFLGIGGSAEFNSKGDCGDCDTDCNVACNTSCSTGCDDCEDCAPSMWSVYLKGGIAFN